MEPVSLETALLLREKKYDWWDCFDAYYTVHNELTQNPQGDNINFQCYAPCQAEIQKWLRGIHRIHITVYWNGDKNYDYSIKTDPTKILNHVKHCESYEIALEQALVESLNLIK